MMKGSLSGQVDLIRTYLADVLTKCSLRRTSQNIGKISSGCQERDRFINSCVSQ